MEWLTANWGSVLVTLVLIAMVVAILRSQFKNRGNSCESCGGSCGTCSLSASGSCPSTDAVNKMLTRAADSAGSTNSADAVAAKADSTRDDSAKAGS